MRHYAYYPPFLAYHSVGGTHPPYVPVVSASAFEAQLAFLKKHRYTVLHCDEVADLLRQDKPLPKRSTLITFDDGYEDNYSVAWPLLRRYAFPATIFVTPGEVGTERFAGWDQLREMQQAGITIGSHTLNHAYLPEASEADLEREIVRSKQEIEARLDAPVIYLSYPVGGYTRRAQEIAKDCGYRLAFTTNRSFSEIPFDLYAVRRVKMTNKDTGPLILRVKLSGYYDSFRSIKQPY